MKEGIFHLLLGATAEASEEHCLGGATTSSYSFGEVRWNFETAGHISSERDSRSSVTAGIRVEAHTTLLTRVDGEAESRQEEGR